MTNHNELTRKFITENLRPMARGKEGLAEVMVIYESLTLGIMLLLQEAFSAKPHAATRLCEVALDQAIERLAAENNKGKH